MFLRLIIVVFLCSCSRFTWAQTFPIGHLQKTFVDASRSNRNIATDIYYPATVSGNNVPVALGTFPVIAFGHGFVMTTNAYDIIWNYLVPQGFIVILPSTEGSISPSHSNFGKDLAFVLQAMKLENFNNASVFYGAISGKTAVMGHSMGGGASFLAAQFDTSISALVTLAAAETNPSAISAAKFIRIPSLTIAGLNDCVAPPLQHQVPMYDSLASGCKTYIGIVGASHCQFASSNAFCSFGESTCTPTATISSSVQQSILFTEILPWLQYYLQDSCNAANDFQQTLINNSAISSSQNCLLTCLCNQVRLTNLPTNVTTAEGTNVVFRVAASGTRLQYQWQLSTNNGVDFVNIPGAIHDSLLLPQVSLGMNNYQYRVVVSNDCPSSATSNSALLKVQASSSFLQEIEITPNPCNGILMILSPSALLSNAKIVVLNAYGQKIKNFEGISGAQYTIDLRFLSTGIYFVKLIQNNQLQKIKKLFFVSQ